MADYSTSDGKEEVSALWLTELLIKIGSHAKDLARAEIYSAIL